MAPPIPVYTRKDVTSLAPEAFEDCPLKKLTQYECEVYGAEIVCVPFTRLFHSYVDNIVRKSTSTLIDIGQLFDSMD